MTTVIHVRSSSVAGIVGELIKSTHQWFRSRIGEGAGMSSTSFLDMGDIRRRI